MTLHRATVNRERRATVNGTTFNGMYEWRFTQVRRWHSKSDGSPGCHLSTPLVVQAICHIEFELCTAGNGVSDASSGDNYPERRTLNRNQSINQSVKNLSEQMQKHCSHWTSIWEKLGDKPNFHLARDVSTRHNSHVRRVEPMHFGWVVLSERHDELDWLKGKGKGI